MRLNFGNNDVSGKVYDINKNATTIPQTTIVKDKLTIPIKTDEMWFPPANLTDAQVDAVIEDVIDTKRTYFNKNVLNPNNKSFVLWKGEDSNFVSNIDFGGGGGSSITVYDDEEELEEDLPNKNDGDLVATYGNDLDVLADDNKAIIINSSMISYSSGVCYINLGTGTPVVGGVYKLYFGEGIVNGSAISSINITSGNVSGNLATGKGNVASHYVTEFTHGGTSIAPTNIAIDWYTILDVMWNGSDWLIVGNPVVVSYNGTETNFSIFADGLIEQSGIKTGTAAQTFNTNITFIVDYKTSYAISVTPRTEGLVNYFWVKPMDSSGNIGVRIQGNQSGDKTSEVDWFARGY